MGSYRGDRPRLACVFDVSGNDKLTGGCRIHRADSAVANLNNTGLIALGLGKHQVDAGDLGASEGNRADERLPCGRHLRSWVDGRLEDRREAHGVGGHGEGDLPSGGIGQLQPFCLPAQELALALSGHRDLLALGPEALGGGTDFRSPGIGRGGGRGAVFDGQGREGEEGGAGFSHISGRLSGPCGVGGKVVEGRLP